ncbi:unnamed protein product [Amaranthus hypochondriacus]
MAAICRYPLLLRPSLTIIHLCNPPFLTLSSCFNAGHASFPSKTPFRFATHFSKFPSFRIRSTKPNSGADYGVSSSDSLNEGEIVNTELLEPKNSENGSNFLAILAIGLGVAATVTILSIRLKQQNLDPSFSIEIQRLADVSSSSSLVSSTVGFSFQAFGYRVVLPQYAPGWIYFWLLVAAGFGLFISEEALNIWVGITLARKLCLDGTWQSFAASFSDNATYIISTVLWVYWGVCISDMIPFYLGKLFSQSGLSDDVYSKLGIGKEKVANITDAIKRYGNLSGFVERFSLGVRNTTSFLAGAMGVSPECFFAGVCCGGLITLPIQLAIGFLLRERPLFALATVATAVGILTMFPYAVAASTALFFYLRQRYSST